MARKTRRWFQPGKALNWSKDDSQTVRRRQSLQARRGKALPVARALNALANVTRDPETARKARADAAYFYRQNRKVK